MSESTTFRAQFSAEPQGQPSLTVDVVTAGVGFVTQAVALGLEWLGAALSTSVEEVETRLRSRIAETHQARLSEYLRPQAGLAPNAPPSSRAANARTQAADLLARAEATLEALEHERLLMAMAERSPGLSLAAMRQGLSRAAQIYREGGLQEAVRLAREAEARLAVAAHEGCRGLETLQRRFVSVVTARTLQDMGYRIDVATSESAVALWATNGQRTLAATVTDSGRVDLDLAGFDGLSCRLESERLLVELAERGLRVRREASLIHGRREGGAMIVSAARQARSTGLSHAFALLQAVGGQSETPRAVHRKRKATRGNAARASSGSDSSAERARRWLWAQQMSRKSRTHS
jgi:hypothetical protein